MRFLRTGLLYCDLRTMSSHLSNFFEKNLKIRSVSKKGHLFVFLSLYLWYTMA